MEQTKEFITLRELESRFVESERVVRHAFKGLIKSNKLKKGEDFFIENYKDDRHFIYKINPERVAEVAEELTPIPDHEQVSVNQADNQRLTKPEFGQQTDNQSVNNSNHPVNQLVNQDILLKQLDVKDEQIQEKDQQIKRLQEDNMELKQTHRFVLEQIFSRLPAPPENRAEIKQIAYEPTEPAPAQPDQYEYIAKEA